MTHKILRADLKEDSGGRTGEELKAFAREPQAPEACSTEASARRRAESTSRDRGEGQLQPERKMRKTAAEPRSARSVHRGLGETASRVNLSDEERDSSSPSTRCARRGQSREVLEAKGDPQSGERHVILRCS